MQHLVQISLLVVATLAGGCAWTPQKAALKLEPQIADSTIGRGVAVPVRVLDRRASQIIGHRGLDSQQAAITTEQNVAALFQQSIVDGLTRKGFRATPYNGERSGVLTVEVQQINYTTDMDFWKGIVQTTCALRAVISKNGATYDRSYVGARKEAAVEAPGAKTNNRLINAAMSAAVQRLFEDERLAAFLAD